MSFRDTLSQCKHPLFYPNGNGGLARGACSICRTVPDYLALRWLDEQIAARSEDSPEVEAAYEKMRDAVTDLNDNEPDSSGNERKE